MARLRKNSSNSSKPPSSDIVKPPKPPAPVGWRKRRIGGQPGHSRHFLLTLSDPATRNYAQCLLGALRRMFRVIHRREQMTPVRFQQALERARQRVLKVGQLAPARREG